MITKLGTTERHIITNKYKIEVEAGENDFAEAESKIEKELSKIVMPPEPASNCFILENVTTEKDFLVQNKNTGLFRQTVKVNFIYK